MSGMSVRRAAFPYTQERSSEPTQKSRGTLLVRHVKQLKHNRRDPSKPAVQEKPAGNSRSLDLGGIVV